MSLSTSCRHNHPLCEIARSRALIENLPFGVLTYDVDGTAIGANSKAAEILGGSVEELLGQNFNEIPSWGKYGLLGVARSAIGSGQPHVFEGEIVSSFGRNLHLSVRFIPFDHDGAVRLLVLVNDIGEQHATISRLKLLEAAIDASPSGVTITDEQGRIQWANAAFERITGYALDEVRNENPRFLKSGRHPPSFYEQMWDCIKSGLVWSGEVENRRKDGGLYTEQMNVAPVLDQAGMITHFIAIKHDISERKNLEEQLARTQRLESIGLLASGLAHDLNNIFAPILLSLDLFRTSDLPEELKRLISSMEAASKRGAGIVKQVLTFARGFEPNRVPFRPRPLLKELAQMLQETFSKNIEIKVETSTEDLMIRGDSNQLHQVLLNLVINARDAMPDGGCLTLRLESRKVDEETVAKYPWVSGGDFVAVSVLDTGTGIPPEVLERMFEPFYTTKPRDRGTGLGLSTVYGIVRSHEGFVTVDTAMGAGTTITAHFPREKCPGEQADDEKSTLAATGLANQHILLAEDEESIRFAISGVLTRHGAVVEQACDGVEAFERFSASPGKYGLIIADLMMPRMNGKELIARIRAVNPSVRVIASTGMSIDDQPDTHSIPFESLGVRTVLHKPYAEGELIAAINRELAES